MAIKIYLSPAAHGHDNPCAIAGCSENTHANRYLDALIPYLDACGILWKRNGREHTGREGVTHAVNESNAFGADLHYVVHTNAANGQARGSRPHVYPTGKGRAWAEALLARRREIYPYPCTVKESRELYEIKGTRAVCIYEELVFHDNPEDAAWLHAHMRDLAAATAKAFCDIFGLTFRDPYAETPGDANGDGRVDTADAVLTLQYAAGLIGDDAIDRRAADINGDGTVDTADAGLILQKTAEQGESPPEN